MDKMGEFHLKKIRAYKNLAQMEIPELKSTITDVNAVPNVEDISLRGSGRG